LGGGGVPGSRGDEETREDGASARACRLARLWMATYIRTYVYIHTSSALWIAMHVYD